MNNQMLLIIFTIIITYITIATFLYIQVKESNFIIKGKNEKLKEEEIQSIKDEMEEIFDNRLPDSIKSLTYSEIKQLINENIAFYVAERILEQNLPNLSNDVLSIRLNNILIDICSKVYLSLSPELRKAYHAFCSDDHLTLYIKDNTRDYLIARIEAIRQLRNTKNSYNMPMPIPKPRKNII